MQHLTKLNHKIIKLISSFLLLISAWSLAEAGHVKTVYREEYAHSANQPNTQLERHVIPLPILGLSSVALIEKIVEIGITSAATIYTGWVIFNEWRERKRKKQTKKRQDFMATPKIILMLNKTEYIELKLPNSVPIHLCDNVEISFYGDIKLPLSNDCITDSIALLQSLLSKAIDNTLTIPEKSLGNLGHAWNEELHAKDQPDFKPPKKYHLWSGLNYHLWSTPGNADIVTDTWLYNDRNANIILEITPTYKWHFSDLEQPENAPGFISYAEFMKNYQSYALRIVPHKTALHWLHQINKLFNTIVTDNKSVA